MGRFIRFLYVNLIIDFFKFFKSGNFANFVPKKKMILKKIGRLAWTLSATRIKLQFPNFSKRNLDKFWKWSNFVESNTFSYGGNVIDNKSTFAILFSENKWLVYEYSLNLNQLVFTDNQLYFTEKSESVTEVI